MDEDAIKFVLSDILESQIWILDFMDAMASNPSSPPDIVKRAWRDRRQLQSNVKRLKKHLSQIR